MVAGILRQRPYRMDLSGWSRARVTKDADTLFSANPSEHGPRRLVDAAVDGRRSRLPGRQPAFLPSRPRLHPRLPAVSTTYNYHLHGQRRIYGSISGGDRETGPQLHLELVAPGHFQQSGGRSIRRHRDLLPGLHGRKSLCRHPAIGWILSSRIPQTPGAQVLRSDSPTSGWVEDQDFNEPLPGQHHQQELSGGRQSRDSAFRSRLWQKSD